MRQPSRSEENVSKHLRPILASLPLGSEVELIENYDGVLSSLEFFLPEVLGEVHSEWNDESLDGIYPALAQKTGDNEIEVIGLCIFISDQTLTPIHLRFQLAPSENAISWLDCKLGESGEDGMVRIPYSRKVIYGDTLFSIPSRLDSIEWVYHVGYGERRIAGETT